MICIWCNDTGADNDGDDDYFSYDGDGSNLINSATTID